jgi:formylglycine-generating enzyme required for sulfatase activity
MTNSRDGADYVYVPGGAFKMGAEEGDERAREDEKPQTSLNVDGFWLMRTEVTNGQYRRCVDAGACAAPNNARWSDPAYAEHPVTGVTWQQANDYTAWVGGRLPTEAEWEKACRGTKGGVYPWGDAAPAEGLANFFPNTGGTMAVGSYSPEGDSPYGAADMAGNVWEWTSSRPDPYPYDAGDGREEPRGEGKRVLRGGAWYLSDDFVRCASRFSFGENYGYYDFGFRVVLPAMIPGG